MTNKKLAVLGAGCWGLTIANLEHNNFDDVVVIKVNRINYESEMTIEQQQHKIENSMNNYNDYDYILTNDTLEKLEQDVISILQKEGVTNEKND